MEMAFYRVEFYVDHILYGFEGLFALIFIDQNFIGFILEAFEDVL